MTIKFYAYPKCATCKKAQTLLNKKGRAYEAIDITLKPPTLAELRAMLQLVGGELKRLFNTSGQVYRDMRLRERLGELSAVEALRLLADNGKLIKRPCLIIDGKAAAVGFDPKAWSELL